MGEQLLIERTADVRSELLVEELLQLESAMPLLLILGIQRWLMPTLLDCSDNSRRIADRALVDRSTGVVAVSPVRRLASEMWSPGRSERRM